MNSRGFVPNSCSTHSWSFAVAVLVAMLCASPQSAWSQSGGLKQISTTTQANGHVIDMPLKGKTSRKSGLMLEVDTRWANNYGYRPVRVRVTSPKPATVDRSITIRLHVGWWTRQRGRMTMEEDFDLPAGATSTEVTIAVPQYQLGHTIYWWDAWVDGIRDKDLSLDEVTAMSTIGGFSTNAMPGMSLLVVGSPARQLTSPNMIEFVVLSLPIKEFPDRWIDYSSFDIVALSLAELESLERSNPKALAAMQRWARAGGQVWIGDAGEQWKRLAEIASKFDLRGPLPDERTTGDNDAEPADSADDMSDETNSASFGWQPVILRRGRRDGQPVMFMDLNTGMRRVARDQTEIERLQQDPNFVTVAQSVPYAAEPEEDDSSRRFWRRPRDSSEWFVQHRLGLGHVRAFRGAWDPAAVVPTTDPEEAAAIDPRQRMSPSMRTSFDTARGWSSRHGLSPDKANGDFADLLVPGVGLAPVTEFHVLITLFVLAIGPLNYWLLNRFGRLHLLILTVPLAAALTTACLFGYAILSDGFGTSVRVRSLTTLDQRSGEATCWARLSFYSGFAPAEGLTFSDDVTIYPIIPGWNETSTDATIGLAREILWYPEKARLTLGWLKSRVPMQYLTVRARRSPLRIRFASLQGRLLATNELGTEIHYVVAADEDGNLHAGKKIGDGGRAALQPTPRTNAIREVRQWIMDHEPEPPDALGGDSEFEIMQRRRQGRMMRRQYGLQYSDERFSNNLLNEAIANLGGLDGFPALPLPPRSYVAFTATGPEVQIGMAGAEEEASFHVVLGQW